MKVIVQRVNFAKCIVNDEIVGQIDRGIVVYLGISKNFTQEKQDWIIDKILKLRLWQSEKKGFDLSVKDIKAEILIISQFTLFGDCKKDTKPNFNDSMESKEAEKIYDKFVEIIKEKSNLKVQTGKFGAKMIINQENDGPVSIILEK